MSTADGKNGGVTMPAPVYYTIAEAALIARCSPKRLQNLMADGTLLEKVHFTRPRGRRPLLLGSALHAWLGGRDDELVSAARDRRQASRSKVNLNGV